jgi:hypothetical protein
METTPLDSVRVGVRASPGSEQTEEVLRGSTPPQAADPLGSAAAASRWPGSSARLAPCSSVVANRTGGWLWHWGTKSTRSSGAR